MVIRPDLDEFMAEVRKHLPPGFDFDVTARLRGAFTRGARGEERDAGSALKHAIERRRVAQGFRSPSGGAAATEDFRRKY
jgi:hypothetical protein